MSGDFLSPHSKDRKKLNKLAAFYDVEGFNYRGQDEGETGRAAQSQGRPGSYNGAKGRVENRTTKDVARDINTAMANGAMGDYLRYSGKDLPMADDYEGLWQLHKEAGRYHKEIGGNNYNNAGSDNFKIADAAFKTWQDDLINDLTPDPTDNEDDNDSDDETRFSDQSLEEAYNTGNLSPSFMDALNTRAASTSAQNAAQALLADTVKKVADKEDKDGLLNSDKYLIDYSQPYNGLS